MNVIARLRAKYAGLVEIGHRYFREGDAERVMDVVDGMERVEGELARARTQARVEAAERLADPDREVATVPEHPASGWVNAPGHLERLSPAIQLRLLTEEATEQAEAAREESRRTATLEARQEEAILERWREDVALGVATVQDLPRYQREVAGGRTRAEALAHFSAEQDADDARLAAAAARYGAMCVQAFGADGDRALAELLDGDARVPARHGRERGWA